jgi:hypothetical protein
LLPKKIAGSSLLAGGHVRIDQTAESLRIRIAEEDRQIGDTVLKLQLNGSAMDIQPIEMRQV